MAKGEAWQNRESLMWRQSDVKLRGLPGGHTKANYFGHNTCCAEHSLGICCGIWAAACSLTDDLLCTFSLGLAPTGKILSVQARQAGQVRMAATGAYPHTDSQKGLLFWSLGNSPPPWADLNSPRTA